MSKIKGLEQVLKNLNKEIKAIENRTDAGVVAAAMHIRREAQKLTPVVTGNLRNSAFVVSRTRIVSGNNAKFKGGGHTIEKHVNAMVKAQASISRKKSPAAVIGFSAAYAPFVHENPRSGKTGGVSPKGKAYKAGRLPSEILSKRKVYSTVGQYKFLEQALLSEKDRVLDIIKTYAEIKK